MNPSLTFIRVLFLFVSILVFTSLSVTHSAEGFTPSSLIIGLLGGTVFALFLISADLLFKRTSFRSFNIAIIGLFCGYLLAEAIMLILNSVVSLDPALVGSSLYAFIRMGVFLLCTYLGMVTAARASDEIYASIPFIKLKPTSHKQKDLILDMSALLDSRTIDLATSGLLDHQLVVPRFLVNELTAQVESSADETIKARARRGLDAVKKLENIPSLDLRFAENDFPELKDPMAKLVRLARMQDANLLTADISKIQQALFDGIRTINLHTLSNALKPITHSGEFIHIKIQRYGKEPRQGVGYLEDGTMVVVNGGAEYIGETIKAQVLSVKHTSSGRMIFCNAMDFNLGVDMLPPSTGEDDSQKNYFSV